MTQLMTIDTNNYAAMAKAMGTSNETTGSSKSSQLARLRIHHSPIMGTAEVNGKNVNVEVIEGGAYKLEIPDGETYYASGIKMRPFLQRFMYKRYVMGDAKTPNRFIKSLMTDDSKMEYDLKDNDGGFNCGKPAGYIKDFKVSCFFVSHSYRSAQACRDSGSLTPRCNTYSASMVSNTAPSYLNPDSHSHSKSYATL